MDACSPPPARARGTTCFRHLFNTFIDGGCKAERKWLEPLLAEGLEAAPRHLRLSAEVEKLVRALARGLGGGFELYGLGSYEGFRAWLEGAYPELLHPALVRAEKGTRQGFQTKATLNAYINRAVNAEYIVIPLVAALRLGQHPPRQPLHHAHVQGGDRGAARARHLRRQVHQPRLLLGR